MLYRLCSIALALSLGSVGPACATNYRFAADVYFDAGTVRRFEASVAPQQSKSIEVAPGFILKFAVGPDSGSGATTITTMAQMRAGTPTELAILEQTGPSSKPRESTLATCMVVAIGALLPPARDGVLAAGGLRVNVCPEGSLGDMDRQLGPVIGKARL